MLTFIERFVVMMILWRLALHLCWLQSDVFISLLRLDQCKWDGAWEHVPFQGREDSHPGHQRSHWLFSFFFNLFINLFVVNFVIHWNKTGFTCVPHPDPPSHLPHNPLPVGFPSAPGPRACLMHPTWAGDLFHPRYYTCFDVVLLKHPTLTFSHRV